jgi:rRNA maturation endonuclease Nob1
VLHNFNNVMKWVGNKSEIKVCLDCFKLFAPQTQCCPVCGTTDGVPFNTLSHHDQEFVHKNQ